MRRGQKVTRGVCPGCRRVLSYSVGVGDLSDLAHFRRHKKPQGDMCPVTMVERRHVRPAPGGGE